MADEIELKLEITAEAADTLEASGFLADDPKVANQRSIYFDTTDRSLSNAGLSLRIRRSGNKRIQTVKADGASAAGLFARSEWERSVSNDTPVLDDTIPIRALLGDAADRIAPLFEVRVERRTWLISHDNALVELAIDRGTAVAGDWIAPICEIELELKAGDPAALFALARRIDVVVPVRLGVLSKAERGYRLSDATPIAFKAEPIVLTGDMTAASALQHIVQTCVRQYSLNESVLQGRRAEALHQARVALRRLRSAFSIFKPIIAGDDASRLREALRWLASELGDARNLDVLLERAVSTAFEERVAAAREAAYDWVEKVSASPPARALMLDLAQWTANGDWLNATDTEVERQRPAREFAVTALDRFRRKVKKDGRDLAGADDRARHKVRKDAKKLRYASEFFTALFERKREKRRYRKFAAALEALQDQLGALNDLATAPAVLEKLGIANDPDASELLAGGKRKALREAAAEAYDDLVDTKRFWL